MWLTDSIDLLFGGERMDWARTLQHKSFTSGAMDAGASPSKGGAQKGEGKGKCRTK